MIRHGTRLLLGAASIALVFFPAFRGVQSAYAQTSVPFAIKLDKGWELQSSAKVDGSGDVLSSNSYHPSGWIPIRVPTTVVAALVKAKIYPDPGFGMNLRQLPGVEYPVGENFSGIAMPPSSPFAASWWYRKQFRLPVGKERRYIQLHFDGINYRANIWLNGNKIADTSLVSGAHIQHFLLV